MERNDNRVNETTTIPDLLLHEAQMLGLLSRHRQHPNIVGYHGCRVRGGFITGLVLDMVPGSTLGRYMEGTVGGLEKIDKDSFMAALQSAVDHLHHVVGIAHNDIHPDNVIVQPDGTPCLIDFNSAAKIGHRKFWKTECRPWHDEKGDDKISQKRRDLYALAKLRWALDHPDKWLADPRVIPVQIHVEVDPTEPDVPDAKTPPSQPRAPGSELPDPEQDGVHLDV